MITKKVLKAFTAIILALSIAFPTSALASNIRVTLNGQEIYFDQPPIIQNNRTLVPVRAIFEAMGATVLWNQESQIIDVATNFGMMVLGIGSNIIVYRNENEDRSIVCDVPPQIINNRTLVPVRAIAECTGYNVDWDGATQTVIITGEPTGLSTPNVAIPKYYDGTQTPDFAACMNIPLARHKTETEYTYEGVTGHNVSDFIETYLVSAGFLIDDEQEIFGLFVFTLSNSKTGENIRLTYAKSDKELIITLSNG